MLQQAIAEFEASVSADSGDLRIVESLARAERLLALQLIDESIDQALELSSRAHSRVTGVIDAGTVKARSARSAAIVAGTHGRIQRASGDEAAAIATWNRALELLQARSVSELSTLAVQRQLIAHLRGEQAAAELAAHLAEAGFDDPRFRLQP
jgi:hypothetical protein